MDLNNLFNLILQFIQIVQSSIITAYMFKHMFLKK